MSENNVDHVRTSEASREMVRPPHEKMRFDSCAEEYRFLAERKVFVQGKLAELNVRLAQRRNGFFQRVGGSTSRTGIEWKRIEAAEFLPERESLVLEINSLESRLAKVRPQAKRELSAERSELYRADGTVNYDRALIEILGSLDKLRRSMEGMSRRLDALEARGLLETAL